MDLIAGFALVFMVILVVADIIGNKFFKIPVPGGIEMVSLLSVIAISFAIAQTQIDHGHIEVEMLVTKFSKNAQKVVSVFVHLFSISLFIILTVMSFKYGLSLQSSHEVTMTLQFPYYPFVWCIGISSIVVVLVLIMQLIQKLREDR